MAGSFTKIAYEAAARALAHLRAMSTLQRRLELASEIESAIESFLAFEKARLARAAQIQADLIERFAFNCQPWRRRSECVEIFPGHPPIMLKNMEPIR
jgi:hypothetical protein